MSEKSINPPSHFFAGAIAIKTKDPGSVRACVGCRVFLKEPRMSVAKNQLSRSRGSQSFDLKRHITSRTAAVNAALNRFLPPATARPATIHRAMRYSLFAGGKRMRPALCLAAAAACGGRDQEALPLA